jgi:hypothetical protein
VILSNVEHRIELFKKLKKFILAEVAFWRSFLVLYPSSINGESKAGDVFTPVGGLKNGPMRINGRFPCRIVAYDASPTENERTRSQA